MLNAIIPMDPYEAYSMHEVIQHVVDSGSFMELQPCWAMNAIVGMARIGGHSVGIVAQEPSVMAGVIDIDAADKMARFVRMCDCFNIPIVTLVDSPGFLPGTHQEYGGIIRHGAKVLYAFSEATVPKITVVTRKAYGGAYVVMSSKYLGTDVTYAWPSAEIAVMGAEGAVNILFRKKIETSPDPVQERKSLVDDYRERFNNPYFAAREGYVDDIIEPREIAQRSLPLLLHCAISKMQGQPANMGISRSEQENNGRNYPYFTSNHGYWDGSGFCRDPGPVGCNGFNRPFHRQQ